MKNLLKKLVQAETTAEKGELAAAEIISTEFGRSGIDGRIIQWEQNRANVVAHLGSSGQRGGLLFACHIDVVPPGQASWEHPPFCGLEKGGRIYGRGSADMKGGTAAIITAIRQIADSKVKLKGDIIFLGSAGEETDSCGAKRFVADLGDGPPNLAGVVIPEPTNFDVITAHRGLLWLKIITKGKAAHGSMPHLGINAIMSMKKVLDELENFRIHTEPHKLLGGCSMSINTISGGKAINAVPDSCSIKIDIRTLPTQNHQEIIGDFEKILAKLKRKNSQFDGTVSVVRSMVGLDTDGNCDFVRDFCSVVGTDKTKAAGFCTDGPYLAALGAPVVIFGPGKTELCHKPDEYIDIADVEKAVEYYKAVILKFLT